jgi:hypothetical protein
LWVPLAARIRALQRGTSVNEVCREAIVRFARSDEDVEARLQSLLAIGERACSSSADAWPGRDQLYGEVLQARGLIAGASAKSRRRASR